MWIIALQEVSNASRTRVFSIASAVIGTAESPSISMMYGATKWSGALTATFIPSLILSPSSDLRVFLVKVLICS
jgi:hypothetical protein